MRPGRGRAISGGPRSRGGLPIASLWRDLAEILLPSACALCGVTTGGDALCGPCERRLPALPGQEDPAPSPLVACVAAVPFEGAWADWLRRFKYPTPGLSGLNPAAEAVVADLARRAAAKAPAPPPGAVIPVPLHPARRRRRGFDPAAVLAAALARSVRRPLLAGALERVRDTPTQTGLARAARRRNVAGAFRARRRSLPRRIWLVDDVVTTGSTLAEAARAARAVGAREVVGVCAARTLR